MPCASGKSVEQEEIYEKVIGISEFLVPSRNSLTHTHTHNDKFYKQ